MSKNENYIRLIKPIIDYTLLNYNSIFLQLGIISIGVIFELFILTALRWLNNIDVFRNKLSEELLIFFSLFTFLVSLTFIVANISAFFYWYCAKKRGGTGTFSETCNSLLWTVLYTFICIRSCYTLIFIGVILKSFLIALFSLFGLIGTLIFGIVKMSIQTAKINKFHSDRGTNVFLLGTILQLPFIFAIYVLVDTYTENFIRFLLPLTAQLTTTVLALFIGIKILKKFGTKIEIKS
ncbi:MAG: hypothetical protein LW832_02920 [Parachlamydia sp.]|jgi:hypothetical protein|nr:hypothetical protein [Parachlamydia sp.]